MFAWAPLPKQFKHLGSVEFCKMLMEKANVAVSPGMDLAKMVKATSEWLWSKMSNVFGKLQET